MKNEKMKCFCDHARAMLACYVELPPEQQRLAQLFVTKKLESLHLIQNAAASPGGDQASELLQKMKQKNLHETDL